MFRKNPDGSISVGMLPEEKPVVAPVAPKKAEPEPAPEKPKTTRKKKKTE